MSQLSVFLQRTITTLLCLTGAFVFFRWLLGPLLPFLLARRAEWEPYKWAVSLAGMVGSVELLILLCCLRSGSMEWFPMVALCILFGSSLLMLPVFLRQVPLPESLQRCKASLYTGTQSVLLLLMLTACLAQGSSGMKQWPVVMFSVI